MLNIIDLNNNIDMKTINFLKSLESNTFNDLEKFFYLGKHRLIHKCNHYFEIYDKHFSRFKGKDITLVEIGVSKGGSLEMWQNYFGPNCTIIGVDIDPECKKFESNNIKIMIGSQDDINFLNKLKSEVPKIDILIDDGGHYMNQQITTFENLFNHISDNGIYLCEDLITSYWPAYGGKYKSSNSFIEYSKNFVDYLNAWLCYDPLLPVNNFTRSVHSIHYYNWMLVIEKRLMDSPVNVLLNTYD